MIRFLILLVSIVSCQHTEHLGPAPVTNYGDFRDGYAARELSTAMLNLQHELPESSGQDTSIFPNPDKLVNHLQLGGNCRRSTPKPSQGPSVEDIEDNIDDVRKYVAETEPELASMSAEEKIKRNFKKLGGTPVAIDQALCFYKKNKTKKFHKKRNGKYSGSTSIKNNKYMVVQDFTKPSSQMRFFIISLEDDPKHNKKAGDVEVMYSAHGYGKDKPGKKSNDGPNAQHFSNESKTNLTPRGFFVTGERQASSMGWKWHMKYDGLQKGINDNSRDRTIVFHPGRTATKGTRMVFKGRSNSLQDNPQLRLPGRGGMQGWTHGCTAVSPGYAEEVYSKIKGKALQYNFTKHEKALGPSYCGHNLITKK